MGLISKNNLKLVATDYAPTLLGFRIPGFIKIHIRYIIGNPFVWAVLFVAPFVIGLVTVAGIVRLIPDASLSGWQQFLLVLFLIALAFYFAERHRTFRRIYVRALPVMVLVNGVMIYLFATGPLFGRLVVFTVLAVLPAWILGKLSMGMGYRMLSNGADRHYRMGCDLYAAGEHDAAFLHLEPSARRGHMKSLYLLGHAHEHGNGREPDRIKAARLYDKSAKKGYGRAQTAFETLFASFTAEEAEAYESDLTVSGINDLF